MNKKKSANIVYAVLIIIFITILTIIYYIETSKDKVKISENNKQNANIEETQTKRNTEEQQGYSLNEEAEIELKINDVSDYKSLSKDDIYNLRKRYVKNSLFASKNYSPSDEVFGSIVSYAPWYGLTYSGCIAQTIGTEKVAEGPSEESRFINNPNMLVGLITGSKHVEIGNPVCFDKRFWVIPSSLIYSKLTNTITAEYDFRYDGPMDLTGLNARDLGYKYVYAIKSDNFVFKNPQNISTGIHEFRDYIHLGGSCRYQNGCNNGSPYQPQLDIYANAFPAVMKMKLWKNRPDSPQVKADINYEIIIR